MRHPILHSALPDGQAEVAAAKLPRMHPVQGPWLFYDASYGDQMALRRELIEGQATDVYEQLDEGLPAARACLDHALAALPDGFKRTEAGVTCPDGVQVKINRDAPLLTLGKILQQDMCILEKRGDEHVLTGAILCFPASWTLAQKIGKPLIGIHTPVDEYDDTIAPRVQRLFDGVKSDRPMWRANLLRYSDPSLFQPRAENDRRPIATDSARYLRSERQTVFRLPHPDAVAFMIHTTIVEAPLGDDGDH